jgi:hypothetical protein
VLNHTSHPSKAEREKIAIAVVETYPFLKDPLLDEDTKPWVKTSSILSITIWYIALLQVIIKSN